MDYYTKDCGIGTYVDKSKATIPARILAPLCYYRHNERFERSRGVAMHCVACHYRNEGVLNKLSKILKDLF